MYRVKATIEGIAPLLFNRPDLSTLEGNPNAGKKKSAKDKMNEAEAKVYSDNGGLYLPARNLKRAMVIGASRDNLKRGAKSLSTYIDALVFFEPERLHFGKQTHDGIHETWGRIPPKTGAAVILRRPMLLPGWSLTVQMLVASDTVSEDNLKNALSAAGLLAGVGGWRPEFGRFVVKKWQLSE